MYKINYTQVSLQYTMPLITTTTFLEHLVCNYRTWASSNSGHAESYMIPDYYYYYTHLTASFPGQRE